MNASHIWMCIAAISLVAAMGSGHKVETVVKPANLQELFR